MQQPNVIKRCYAKSMKVCLPNQNIMQYNAIFNNHMSYYAVMQIGKYLWFKPSQVHIVRILKHANLRNRNNTQHKIFGSPLDVHRIDAK